ncbi:helix-turn-helix transcriptional regulator [Actinomadura graeca]|uniref:Helix-turn-helix transcriptional regulator n=1 Tax=Actinomadura graeca TaxID=2750812 RepID=A0ABX8QW96_9ACTN|nr:helix-turn-helix transcriptional regulator [Actinomadura graeca]QXJ22893.1 helix-turn-helix transcriptional regulator [Actinomadura graeca]
MVKIKAGESELDWLADSLRLVGRLTPRELQVFLYLGYGCDNRSISQNLQISERTVKRHITSIMEKLVVQSRLQAGLVSFVISQAPACEWNQSSSPFDSSP